MFSLWFDSYTPGLCMYGSGPAFPRATHKSGDRNLWIGNDGIGAPPMTGKI